MKNNTEKLIKDLQHDVSAIRTHKLFAVYNSIYKLLAFQFMKGIAFGLGSVVGATIVVSVLLYFLTQIELIPIIGDWVKLIISEIQPDPGS